MLDCCAARLQIRIATDKKPSTEMMPIQIKRKIKAELWTDDLRFYVLATSISVIAGQKVGDNKRLFAMESRL